MKLQQAAQIIGSLGGRPSTKLKKVYWRGGFAGDNWILITGYWVDTGIWIDTDLWIDN